MSHVQQSQTWSELKSSLTTRPSLIQHCFSDSCPTSLPRSLNGPLKSLPSPHTDHPGWSKCVVAGLYFGPIKTGKISIVFEEDLSRNSVFFRTKVKPYSRPNTMEISIFFEGLIWISVFLPHIQYYSLYIQLQEQSTLLPTPSPFGAPAIPPHRSNSPGMKTPGMRTPGMMKTPGMKTPGMKTPGPRVGF